MPPESLFHYTATAGLLGILQEEPKLWASDVRFMNDAQELIYAMDAVVEGIKTMSSPTLRGDHWAHEPDIPRLQVVKGTVVMVGVPTCGVAITAQALDNLGVARQGELAAAGRLPPNFGSRSSIPRRQSLFSLGSIPAASAFPLAEGGRSSAQLGGLSVAFAGSLLGNTEGHGDHAPAAAVAPGLADGGGEFSFVVGDVGEGDADPAQVGRVFGWRGGGVERIQPGLCFGGGSFELFTGSGHLASPEVVEKLGSEDVCVDDDRVGVGVQDNDFKQAGVTGRADHEQLAGILGDHPER